MVRECRPRARAGEFLAGAPFDNDNVDTRQRQLACQHQSCRTSADDNHRMLGCTHLSLRRIWPEPALLRMTRVLKQDPYALHIKVGKIGILLSGYLRGRAESCGNSFVMSRYGHLADVGRFMNVRFAPQNRTTAGGDACFRSLRFQCAGVNERQPLCDGREETLHFFLQVRDRLAIAREMPQQASLEEPIKQRIEGAPRDDRLSAAK